MKRRCAIDATKSRAVGRRLEARTWLAASNKLDASPSFVDAVQLSWRLGSIERSDGQ